MPCKRLNLPGGGVAIACSRGPQPKRFHYCKGAANLRRATMQFKQGMTVQHIDTKAVGVVVRDAYTAGRNYGARQIEYVDVAVTNDKGTFLRTWRTENVRRLHNETTALD